MLSRFFVVRSLRVGLAAVGLAASLAGVSVQAADEMLAAQRPEIARQLQGMPALAGEGLLKAAPPNAVEAQRRQANGILRERSATVDLTYLRTLIDSEALTIDSAGAIVGAPPRAVLNLFDDLNVRIVKLQTSRTDLGQQILRAAVIDDGGGYATIVIDNGSVTANVTTAGRTVTIQPVSGGLHRIIEFDATAQTRDPDDAVRPPVPDGVAPALAPSPRAIEKSGATATTQIRILVVYTPRALALMPAMRSNIALAIDDLNATLANSQNAVQFTLVGIDQVNYTEQTGVTSSQILNDMSNNVGDFARVQTLRQAVGADLVSTVAGFDEAGSTSTSRICGRAYINDTLNASSISFYLKYGASVVSVNGICLATLSETFSHEIGHNLGGNHDRYVLTNPAPGPTFYAAGYVDLVGKFRDTMAYFNQCADNNITCTRLPYYSNPNLTYNGRALGIPDSQPQAANVARKVGEIAPFIAQFHGQLSTPATPVLATLVSGSGTITSAPNGINCGNTCSTSFSTNQQVTLTATAPVGWSLKEWGGACSGAGTCTVTMNTSKSVTATFAPTLRFGPVFSSAQPSSLSFLRLINTGTAAGTATVNLADYSNGNVLGRWTSPSIAAGTAPQFAITDIESVLGSGPKPLYYSMSVQSTMSGYAQHVLWKPSDGTLTNLSTCEVNVAANASQVAHVHSSVLESGYPSTVAINNTSTSNLSSLTLGIYDIRDGAKLGTYVTGAIPAGGRLLVRASAMEAAAHIVPTESMFHYLIKVESAFTGFLEHLVNNQAAGVITDVTTECSFDTPPAQSATVAVLQPGPIYSSAQNGLLSFLRFINTGTTAGTVAVTLRNYLTGARIGQWTSPEIPVASAPQYSIFDIENALGVSNKPQYYTAQVETQISGALAHVLWKPSDGTLTNLTTCDAGIATTSGQVSNVHSSLLRVGYPSSVVITNTGMSNVTSLTLGIYDARNGNKLGTYTTGSVPANGQRFVNVDDMEASAHIVPTAEMFHYVIKVESAFTGFLQHLVNNQAVGVITDMTTVCTLPAKAVTYADCTAGSGAQCSATVGTGMTGQLKVNNSYGNYRVALTQGRSYTIAVKGASSGNGTLGRPYIYMYGPSGGSSIAQGGGGGGVADASINFTPSSSGTYTVQVTSYITSDNAGTFVLTVQ